jgi:hypothetical protein
MAEPEITEWHAEEAASRNGARFPIRSTRPGSAADMSGFVKDYINNFFARAGRAPRADEYAAIKDRVSVAEANESVKIA